MNKPSDSYRTDDWVMSMFDWWYDPCPYNPEYDPLIHENGLKTSWAPHTFVNPPYSSPLPWIEKAIEEHELGKTIVLLLKHDSSTRWYQKLHEAGANFLLIQGRLKHHTGKSCAFPSVLAVLS